MDVISISIYYISIYYLSISIYLIRSICISIHIYLYVFIPFWYTNMIPEW